MDSKQRIIIKALLIVAKHFSVWLYHVKSTSRVKFRANSKQMDLILCFYNKNYHGISEGNRGGIQSSYA